MSHYDRIPLVHPQLGTCQCHPSQEQDLLSQGWARPKPEKTAAETQAPPAK